MTPRERNLCILCKVAIKHGATLTEMLAKDRSYPVAHIRFAGYAALKERGFTYSMIGRLFNRDPSTVRHGVSRVPELQGNLLAWGALYPRKQSPTIVIPVIATNEIAA
jgi:hypothetical protein